MIIRFEDIPDILNSQDIEELKDSALSKGTVLNTLHAKLNSEELSSFIDEFLDQNPKEEFLIFCNAKSISVYNILTSSFNWGTSSKGRGYWSCIAHRFRNDVL